MLSSGNGGRKPRPEVPPHFVLFQADNKGINGWCRDDGSRHGRWDTLLDALLKCVMFDGEWPREVCATLFVGPDKVEISGAIQRLMMPEVGSKGVDRPQYRAVTYHSWEDILWRERGKDHPGLKWTYGEVGPGQSALDVFTNNVSEWLEQQATNSLAVCMDYRNADSSYHKLLSLGAHKKPRSQRMFVLLGGAHGFDNKNDVDPTVREDILQLFAKKLGKDRVIRISLNSELYTDVIHASAKVAAHISIEYASGSLVNFAAGIEEMRANSPTVRQSPVRQAVRNAPPTPAPWAKNAAAGVANGAKVEALLPESAPPVAVKTGSSDAAMTADNAALFQEYLEKKHEFLEFLAARDEFLSWQQNKRAALGDDSTNASLQADTAPAVEASDKAHEDAEDDGHTSDVSCKEVTWACVTRQGAPSVSSGSSKIPEIATPPDTEAVADETAHAELTKDASSEAAASSEVKDEKEGLADAATSAKAPKSLREVNSTKAAMAGRILNWADEEPGMESPAESRRESPRVSNNGDEQARFGLDRREEDAEATIEMNIEETPTRATEEADTAVRIPQEEKAAPERIEEARAAEEKLQEVAGGDAPQADAPEEKKEVEKEPEKGSWASRMKRSLAPTGSTGSAPSGRNGVATTGRTGSKPVPKQAPARTATRAATAAT
eukprot:TRINITY_DN121607_c0_g1_i1.p1 TRINITY_DN121607_c0_g1~~TRINITY_DN121607_c0_g1_i1.p1  ORF type:complete len:666 (+),score=183.52 TRINITY_DN121607_c0_g1_i1:86-2083(+)